MALLGQKVNIWTKSARPAAQLATEGRLESAAVAISLEELGDQIQAAREDRRLSQPQLARAISPPTNRSAVAHLEQGRRLGDVNTLQRICEFLGIPTRYWKPFLEEEFRTRVLFEEAISELVGRPITL